VRKVVRKKYFAKVSKDEEDLMFDFVMCFALENANRTCSIKSLETHRNLSGLI